MIERTISLDRIDPLEFFGAKNSKLEVLCAFFPKIKITSRGNELFTIGSQKDIETFETKLNLLVDHYNKYNSLTIANLKRIVTNDPKGIENLEDPKNIILFGNTGKIIRSRTSNQQRMVDNSYKNDLLFAVGPAGSGKTYMAIALAVRALKKMEVKKIILSRPAVEAGESLGFLPGDMKEKIAPYLQPLYDALGDMIPAAKLADYLENDIIQIAPLAYMRGRTLNDAFVILDEAQNTTTTQLKMFLTRMGVNAKFVVTGDLTQIDLPRRHQSGLVEAFKLLKNIDGISFIEFDRNDIVRHPLVKKIVFAYDKQDEREEKIRLDQIQKHKKAPK